MEFTVLFLVLEQGLDFWVDDFTCLGLKFKVQGVRLLSGAFLKLRTRWFPEGNAVFFCWLRVLQSRATLCPDERITRIGIQVLI